MIIIIVAIVMYLKNRKNGGNTHIHQQGSGFSAPSATNRTLSDLYKKDPNFNEQVLLEKVSNRFVQLQNAWQNKDLAPARMFLTDALYGQLDRQLDAMIKRGETNYIERIAVLKSQVYSYSVEGDDDVLFIRLDTRFVDYTVNDKTGEVVKGDKNKELFMGYEWKLIRNKDRTTPEEEELTVVNCPNCGAPLSVNHSGQCEYCGSVITLADHDWALSQIRAIYQQSGR